jgi:hypothetical protein
LIVRLQPHHCSWQQRCRNPSDSSPLTARDVSVFSCVLPMCKYTPILNVYLFVFSLSVRMCVYIRENRWTFWISYLIPYYTQLISVNYDCCSRLLASSVFLFLICERKLIIALTHNKIDVGIIVFICVSLDSVILFVCSYQHMNV